MQRNIKKENSLGVIVLLGLVVLVVLFSGMTGDPIAVASSDIIKVCENSEDRAVCYETEIPKLMDQGFSMEDAFAVTKIVQDFDDTYTYCHVLGHYLSARETSKDPLLWKEVVARAPRGVCSNGAIHGAFQERFRTEALPDAEIEELKPELEGICAKRRGWNPTPLEQATCTHALGHLTMYVTEANIQKSLALCDEIALRENGRDMRQLCYDGAFMQIYQPLDPEDFWLIEGKEIESKVEAGAFCNTFSGAQRGSCISESWPLYLKEIQEPNGIDEVCSAVKSNREQEERCYLGLYYVVTAIFNLDLEKVTSYCSSVSSGYQDKCFANASSRMIETDWRNIDKSLALCSEAINFGVEAVCYDELLLYSSYNFVVGSEEFFSLCNKLPPPWKESCLNQNKR